MNKLRTFNKDKNGIYIDEYGHYLSEIEEDKIDKYHLMLEMDKALEEAQLFAKSYGKNIILVDKAKTLTEEYFEEIKDKAL